MNGDQPESWQAQRDRAVTARAAALAQARAVETAQARQLIAEFTATARARALPAEPLIALGYDGRGRYRTGLRGWYLNVRRSVAVGVDGEFYLLTVPSSLRARLLGTVVQPSDPPLTVGAGGRDGESIPLRTLLQRRLSD